MSETSIIIKRPRIESGDGHHGGAWKVAYADFVTAMMAFFLLMWLLNATTEEQRKGLADYFDPAIPISPISGGGDDMLEGDTAYALDSLAHNNHGGEDVDEPDDEELVMTIEAAIQQAVESGEATVTLSDEGVVVELLEAEGSPLFALGNAAPSDRLRSAVERITPVMIESGRPIKFVGHTDSLSFRAGSSYSNWELSSERANAARRLAEQNGLISSVITEVVGRADRFPLVEDRAAPENRRISIIMQNMGQDAMALEAR